VCRRQECLAEAVRRARWAQAFRAPATLRPETIDRVRALIEAEEMPRLSTECAGAAVEGRW
jgi:hypothetical protein